MLGFRFFKVSQTLYDSMRALSFNFFIDKDYLIL